MAFQSKPAILDSLVGRKGHFYGQLQTPDVDSILNGSAQSIQKLNQTFNSSLFLFQIKFWMDCRNFIYTNWHNGREMSVVESSAPYHVTMQKYNEEEDHIEIPKDVFADIINVDWARMFFSQLAYNQTPYDLVYKQTAEQDECLKKDSCFLTTNFHLESQFQKHNIKRNLPLAMVICIFEQAVGISISI